MDIVQGFENRLQLLHGENLRDIYTDYIRMVRGNGALSDQEALDILMVITHDARNSGYEEALHEEWSRSN
jgi:hypothetical protein